MPPSPPERCRCANGPSAPQRRPGAMRDGDFDVGNGSSSDVDEVEHLSPKGRLETICNVPLEFSAQADRLLADRSIEGHRPIDHRIGGFLAADDLQERNQMGRIERLAEHDPLGKARIRLHWGHWQARRTRRRDNIGWQYWIEPVKQVFFDIRSLRPVLLHEIATDGRFFEVRVKDESFQ